MREIEKIRSRETVENIKQLVGEGIEKISLIMRHSDRNFHDDSAREPFMGLTEKGKNAAFKLGELLPAAPEPKLFSSFFGRCIETAWAIDKGYTRQHGKIIAHNNLVEELSPFYIKDINKAIAMVSETGTAPFLRSWFSNEISDKVILNAQQSADIIASCMIRQMHELPPGQIAICVSHDWNLFPLKEYKLGLKHEECGNVGYLESVIIFEKQGQCYITNYQSQPKKLSLDTFIN